MFQSLRYSHLFLRIGIAIMFLWFGISKCIQPYYWVDTWMPQWLQHFASALHASPANIAILIGILEVLIAISIASSFFVRIFASLAIVLLVLMAVTHQPSELLAQDIGLVGALVALVMWPERRYV